jgi:hypothetical protein
MLGLPVCGDCQHRLLHRPFPAWLRFAAVALAVLVAVTWIRNWRFFEAQVHISQVEKGYVEGREQWAAHKMTRAAQCVPENAELAMAAMVWQADASAAKGDFRSAAELMAPVVKQFGTPDIEEKAAAYALLAEVTLAREAMMGGDASRALEIMNKLMARNREPWLRHERDLYQAVDFMNTDRSARAVEILTVLAAAEPQNELVSGLLLDARAGAAYEAEDYDGFLRYARQKLQRLGDQDEMALAGVASALACKYAVTGETNFRDESQAMLERAEKLATHPDVLKEYSERIRYRLDTREIITKAQYDHRFRSTTAPAMAGAAQEGEQ